MHEILELSGNDFCFCFVAIRFYIILCNFNAVYLYLFGLLFE